MNDYPHPRPLSPVSALGIFVAFAVLLFLQTHLVIPWLSETTGVEPIVFWFAVGGLGVFLPLLLASWFLLNREGFTAAGTGGRGNLRILWTERLRFRRMNAGDWLWTFAAIIAIGALSGGIMKGLEALLGSMDTQPPFMRLEPLGVGRYWLLAAWLPYWILNIMGEEILWRGVMQPRMEAASGDRAWLIHGFGWTLFHLAFGWELLLTMLPILFILPWAVQKRRNSWIGVAIHAIINGPSFILIALGLL